MIIKKKTKLKPEKQDELVEELIPDSGQEQNSREKDDEINLFDLDNIDFKQRQERRRGDRRRGFRRIDDRNLISRAKEEANSIRAAAAKEGYQQGLEEAKADIENIKETMGQFLNAQQIVYDNIAPDILEISLDIAKKIIKKEMKEDPEVLLENVRDILKGLSKEEAKITLKVNSAQAELLKQEIPEILKVAGLEARVMVVPDDNTMEGGCMVTTTNGVIDATMETQLSIITQILKEI